MNYKKIYDAIIFKALTENRFKSVDNYYESHHIVPRCMGGLDESDNLVLLTAKEHFVCHHLLFRHYIHTQYRYSLGKAWWLMSVHNIDSRRTKHNINSSQYSQLRKLHAESCRMQFTGRKLSVEQLEQRRSNNPNRREVDIDGRIFPSIKDAADFYDVSTTFFRRWIDTDPQYIYDIEYRKEIVSHNISSGRQNKGTGSWVDKMGEEAAAERKKAAADRRIGFKLSDESRQKISESRRGKPTRLGMKSTEETRQKISEARKGVSTSAHHYKIVEPSGVELFTNGCGLPMFWKNHYGTNLPSSFRNRKGKDHIIVIQGKYKGFELYVLS